MLTGLTINDGSVVWRIVNNLVKGGSSVIINNGSDGGNNTRNIGELVYSTLPVIDGSLHLLDGALIHPDGVYSDFVNYIEQIYTEDSPYFYHDKTVVTEFKAPTLNWYNMIGGDNFAVWADKWYSYPSYRPFRLFDDQGNTGDSYAWIAKSGIINADIVFYNPDALRVVTLSLRNGSNPANSIRSGKVYGSHDGRNWDLLQEFVNDTVAASAVWDITIDYPDYYRWYKLNVSADSTIYLNQISIGATYINEHGNDEVFTQPVLTDEYPPGLDKFGVYTSSLNTEATYPVWAAFNPSTTNFIWNNNHSEPQNYFFYNPDPINVKAIRISTSDANNLKSANLYGFNEETMTWDFVGNARNDFVNAANLQYSFEYYENQGYYRTYKMEVVEWTSTGACRMLQMHIVANEMPKTVTAEEQYYDELNKYGCCGKFLYDPVNHTVRLPKITGIISATNDSSKVGEINKEHMLNILTGYGYSFYEKDNYPNLAGKAIPQQINQYLYMVIATEIKLDTITANYTRMMRDIDRKIERDELTEIICVVETYQGTNSWYRLYSDGWVEQGGTFESTYSSYTVKTFTFLKQFKDTQYMAFCHSGHTADLQYPALKEKTTEYVTFAQTYNSTGCGNWYACGYAAEEE